MKFPRFGQGTYTLTRDDGSSVAFHCGPGVGKFLFCTYQKLGFVAASFTADERQA